MTGPGCDPKQWQRPALPASRCATEGWQRSYRQDAGGYARGSMKKAPGSCEPGASCLVPEKGIYGLLAVVQMAHKSKQIK